MSEKIKKTKVSKKSILVTGGAGFIGSHLVKRLAADGYEIVIVDDLNDYYDPQLKRDRLDILLKDSDYVFEKVNIANLANLKKVFEKYNFDMICHLAAQAGVRKSLKDPWIYEQSNILGTMNLLELAKDFDVKKFVFASSSSVYGGNTKVPFSESDRVDSPVSFYACTKRSKELLAHTYNHLYGTKITALRFFTVYGPWGRPDMSYFGFTDLMTQGKQIDVYNHGKMRRDFTYIDDVVDGIVSALEKDFNFEIFNLGNNKPVELMKFIEILEENLGMKADKRYLPMQPGDVVETWADIEKAKKELGYDPKTTIEGGLKKFVDWYKEYNKS
ncbi:MAG: GDP-mannose 4,6-dehydratase [Candidatus Pacebacteria bacterium]|nr:GDP-mannose 4,6-dehydratase [Candidatus Paceibacterota bacterium]